MLTLRRAITVGCCTALLAGPANAAGPVKTEVLPANGGDLGKAYVDLAAAMKAGDKERAGKLLDPRAWHLADKQKSWFEMFAEMGMSQPAGGRIQGDRGTLFLSNPGNPLEFRYMSATRTSGGWRFDSPTSLGSSFSRSEERDCKTSKMFPCGVKTAPDSAVSGTLVPRSPAPDMPLKYQVIDGLAVPLVAAKGGAPAGTRVILSINGINPVAVALNGDPQEVSGWLGWPVISLEIAKDGNTAKMEYYDGMSRRSFDIAKGLMVESTAPGRIRGQLKTEIEKTVFDVAFDLAATSSCQVDAYRCGSDAP
ncbi:MAG: hypothetical protein ABI584_05870 [Acidobacteriota bacterium]